MNIKEILKNEIKVSEMGTLDPDIVIMSEDAPGNAYDFTPEVEEHPIVTKIIPRHKLASPTPSKGIPGSFVSKVSDSNARKYVKQTKEQKSAYSRVTAAKKIFIEVKGHSFEVKKFLIQAWIREDPTNIEGMNFIPSKNSPKEFVTIS